MKSKFAKRTIVLIMTLVMLMSMASPVRLWAAGYDPINIDLNDPNDPVPDNCWLQHGQLEYVLATMRPIIDQADVKKYVYTDKSFSDEYLITDDVYFVGEGNEVTLYVKFVQTMYNGDTQSKYYYVIVHGPPVNEYMYMESLAGQSTHPILGNEGTKEDPYATTITVPKSKDKITFADIKKTPDNGTGYNLIYPNSDYDIGDVMDSVNLVVGENHLYIVILNSGGLLLRYYDITVVRMPTSFTVTYKANGGIGADIDVEVYDGDTYEVADNTFTPPTGYGYTFIGWNIASDGPGATYFPGDEIKIADDVTLYAQWTPDPCKITYKANGGTGEDVVENLFYRYVFQVKDNMFTPPAGYTFSGWNTSPDGSGMAYEFDNIYIIYSNVTLYAQWEPGNDLTITYDAQGGSPTPPSETFLSGETAQISNQLPIRLGYTFMGWNTDPGGDGTYYQRGQICTSDANLHLYAIWGQYGYSSYLISAPFTGSSVMTTSYQILEAHSVIRYDVYQIWLTSGQEYTISMESPNFDSYLYLLDPQQQYITEDDDSGGNLNAMIIYSAPTTGTYYILVSQYSGNSYGSFTLSVKTQSTATIYASNESGRPGDSVTVALSLEGNPGLASLALDIHYNASGLEVESITSVGRGPALGGLIFNGVNYETYTNNPFRVSWFGTSNDYTNGDILLITFRILETADDGYYAVWADYLPANTRDDGLNLVPLTSWSGGVSVFNFVYGDTDGDGVVTLGDAICIAQYINGWTVDIITQAADVDGDGVITLADAILIAQYVNGWFDKFPADGNVSQLSSIAPFSVDNSSSQQLGDNPTASGVVPSESVEQGETVTAEAFVTDGYRIYGSNFKPAPASMVLNGGSAVQFYATLDGAAIENGVTWVIANPQLATVNANGLVSVNKNKYTGQAVLMLYDSTNKLLDSITLRVV